MSVSPKQYRQTFLESELATEIQDQLSSMENDPSYMTRSYYVPNRESEISFSEKHFMYLSTHQNVQPRDYIKNLRLKTKIR